MVAITGDVADSDHRRRLVETAGEPIDLLVNNASLLGPSPLPLLARYPLEELRSVYEANVFAPLALVQLALPRFSPHARIVNLISDAAVEAYESWGGYGSSKARSPRSARCSPPSIRATASTRSTRRHAHPDATGRLSR